MKRWIHAAELHKYRCEPKFFYNNELQKLKSGYDTTAVSETKAIDNIKYRLAKQIHDSNTKLPISVILDNIKFNGRVYDLSEEPYTSPTYSDRRAEKDQYEEDQVRQAELAALKEHQNSNDYDFEEYEEEED